MSKRILIINYEYPPLGGGGGVAAHNIAQGFIKLGYDVDYVTSGFRGLPRLETTSEGIQVFRVPILGRKELQTASFLSMVSFIIPAILQSSWLLRRRKYKFINTHFAIPSGPVGVIVGKFFGVKNILSIHGGDIFDPTKKMSPHKSLLLRFVVASVLNHSDKVVAQSSNTKANANKYYSYKKDIHIIPLPYQPFVFSKKTRSQLGLNSKCFYLVTVGRLVKRKGFDYLIRTLSLVKDPKLKLLIVGDGPERSTLEKLIKNNKMDKRVNLLGALSEEKKFQYLNLSDLYILSSVHEGFGIVIQEAMQVGLPIIATNNGGQTDLIEDGENGFLIPFGNKKRLLQRIEQLRDNHLLRNKFTSRNKKRIKNFEPEVICRQYERLV